MHEPGQLTEELSNATEDQLRALGSPVRIRILRLCLDTERTNKELAEALRLNPATTLRHVRQLVTNGFLEPTETRRGARGSVERPYRATQLTCRLALDDVGHPELAMQVHVAVADAYLAELREAGTQAIRGQARGLTRLSATSQQEFVRRITEVLDEFGDRNEDGGEALSFLWSLNKAPSIDATLDM